MISQNIICLAWQTRTFVNENNFLSALHPVTQDQ
jgi:hypothetical protein